MSNKNDDNAKSIDLGEESDEDMTEAQRQERFDSLRNADENKVSYWNISQQTRDHAIQMIVRLGDNLGSTIDGVFRRGVYARRNIDGIRQYISHKDDRDTRELMILISTINLMPNSLVPLFEISKDDTDVMVPVLKLFLALTRPPSSRKRTSIVTRVREKPLNKESKEDCARRVKEEKKFQKNAYEQISALMSFKEALVSEKTFDIIYEYVDGPISKDPRSRTPDDLKSIETVLFLICNLLQIQSGPFSLSTEQIRSRSLQNKLILILAEKRFFDLFNLLCTTINKQGNNQWNGLVMEILHYILWDRDMKEIVHAVRNKGQSDQEYLAKKKLECRAANAGKLRCQIQNERKNRLLSVPNASDQRMNRFGGMIKTTTVIGGCQKVAANQADTSIAKPAEKTSVSVLKRGLTANGTLSHRGTVGSQINSTNLGGGKRRGRKCSFAATAKASSTMQSLVSNEESVCGSGVNVLQATMKSSMVGGLGDEERKVNVVLADFLDDFLEIGFGELVRSMKRSWSRADASTFHHYLLFYHFATACLHYERLLHLDDQKAHYMAKDKGETAKAWLPDLKNITECFDKSMITHVTDTISKHFETAGALPKLRYSGDLVVTMLLYKEIISFLRIMLESEETAHNDIAMSALYRIFFNPASKDCQDVLPLLLRNWSTRIYSKTHMMTLIELCHETLKLLDLADTFVRNEEMEDMKLSKKEIEWRESNFAAARNFSKEMYFQRITTPVTVSMYTKALEYYRENSPQLNHYIYIYLKRMKEHIIETDELNEDLMEDEDANLTKAEMKKRLNFKKLNLSHLLFNIRTLNIFNVILNDHENNRNIEQLVQLIKCTVRKFGELADKNHLIYVEILLHHTFPVKYMTDVFSTYQAADLARNYRTYGRTPNRQQKDKNGNVTVAIDADDQRPQYSSESEVDSDEFSRLARPVEKKKRSRKKKSDLRERIEKKRNNRKRKMTNADGDSSDDSHISESEIADLIGDNLPSVSRKSRSTRNKNDWSATEDGVLRRLYKLYAGSHSVFAMIAQDSSLVDLGGRKNSQKVERRVQQLGLHLELANISSSEDISASSSEASDHLEDETGTRDSKEYKKRKRKGHKKEQVKKDRKKQKSNYFLSSNANADDSIDNGVESGDDVAASSENEQGEKDIEDPINTSWSVSSPNDDNSRDTVGEKPFWEDDLDEEDDKSFDERMKVLAAKGLGIEDSPLLSAVDNTLLPKKKKTLLKKSRDNIALSDDSDSDFENINDDASKEATGKSNVRASILIDSDDE